MSARAVLLFGLLWPALPAQDDVTGWVAELVRLRDDADVKLIEKISGVRTREAAEGLIKAYDAVTTLLFKREILRGLLQFTNTPETEQPVLQKFANVAVDGDADETMRATAITGLGQSSTVGKKFLKQIVDAEIPDSYREPAIREHIKLAAADDANWYRAIWNYKQEQRKDSKGNIAPPELNTVRQLAVQGLLPFLGEAEIVDGLKREVDPKIRRALLTWMNKQSMPKTVETAEWVLDRVDFPGVDRALAATILMQRNADKAVTTFLDLAKKSPFQTQEDLRETMASLIAARGDDATDKRLAKLIGKGKPHEKVFYLKATVKITDPKVLKDIRKGLTDEALEVRRATAEVLGLRRDRDSLPDLRTLLNNKQPGNARIAIEAITAIEGLSSAWLKEVTAFCTNPDRETRNAAVDVLGQSHDKRFTSTLVAALAHDDWSTRFEAIEALQAGRDKAAVGPLIDRMSTETGRMKKRLAEALWQLTAQPFEEDTGKWQTWWKEAAEKFTVATEKDLDKAAAERERRRLTERTAVAAKFFGLKIESHRVIFILDISGSMLESMYGRYVGKHGASRIDVAKQEVSQAIKNLEPGTLFNILIFSSSVDRWQKEGIGVVTDQSREAALTWVERLGASGATNLYDAVKMAFDDKDVDTIFIMSDGEPTNGEVIDPYRIREDVAFWNKHRKIKINSIAIGGNLEILEWLAKDAGGLYVQMR